MVAALLAGGAGHVGDGAPGVDDQRELLRGRPDVQPRRVIPNQYENNSRASDPAEHPANSVGKNGRGIRTVPTRW